MRSNYSDLKELAAYDDGQRDLLVFLTSVASNTRGAEVWRALFNEILKDVGSSR